MNSCEINFLCTSHQYCGSILLLQVTLSTENFVLKKLLKYTTSWHVFFKKYVLSVEDMLQLVYIFGSTITSILFPYGFARDNSVQL